jgi:ABC-2 type transport system permease protein
MAQLVRAGLVQGTFDMPLRSLVVLVAWCVASVAGASLALRRRA